MPTGIDPVDLVNPVNLVSPLRRRWLGAVAVGGLLHPLGAVQAGQAPAPTRLLCAWQSSDAHHIGLLDVGAETATVQQSLVVPTRAHGLLVEASGGLLAMARRPGDWLVRWQPRTATRAESTQWQWVEDDRRFNGHVMASPDGRTLWTTETDLDTGQGFVAVRDVRTLAKTAEWATQGMDPHELLVLPRRLGDVPAGSLLVANGGIPSQSETGRAKRDLGSMDASLVALHSRTGRVLGQWRLSDPRLSIRHLAWDAASGHVGIALQAEHDDPADRQATPLLAVWNGHALHTASGQPALAGYGGDICAQPGGGFIVSGTRAHQLAVFDAQATWQASHPLEDACALGNAASRWWAAGRSRVLTAAPHAPTALPADLRLDNHWQAVEA